jgi:NHLM bacteriocin system ABC transporter ATP-binding protein
MRGDNLFKIFQEKGEKIKIAPRTRFQLAKENMIWFLEKGSLNLFLIEKISERGGGALTFLIDCSKTSLLFPLNTEHSFPFEIDAVAKRQTMLWQLPMSTFQKELKDKPRSQRHFATLLSKWILKLSSCFSEKPIAKPGHFSQDLENFHLNEEEILHVSDSFSHIEKAIYWIQVSHGRLDLFDSSHLQLSHLNGSFPLTQRIWGKSKDKTHIVHLPMEKIVSDASWAKGLENFHLNILKYLSVKKEENERDELRLLKIKKEEEASLLNFAFEAMIEVLNPIKGKPEGALEKIDLEKSAENAVESPMNDLQPSDSNSPFQEESQQIDSLVQPQKSLFASCQLIGQIMNIQFSLPEHMNSKNDTDHFLDEICEASKIRHRKVILEEKWWKLDNGPLIAFLGKEKKPIALIYGNKNQYEMIDPDSDKKQQIEEGLSEQLQSYAYTFYLPLPAQVMSGKQVCAFYFKKNHKELLPLLFFSLIAAIIPLFPPFAYQILFDHVALTLNVSLIAQLGFALLVAAVSSALFFYLRSLSLLRIQGLFLHQVQSGIWDRLLKLRLNFFQNHSSGNLMGRAMATEEIRNILAGNAIRVAFSGVFALFYIVIMIFFSPVLACISIILLSISLGMTLLFARYKMKFEKMSLSLQGVINGTVLQLIKGVSKLRVAGAENRAFSYWAPSFAKNKSYEMKAGNANLAVNVINAALAILSFSALFAIAMALNDSKAISLGTFLAFNAAFGAFSIAIFDLSHTLMQTTSVFPLWQRSRPILEAPQEKRNDTQSFSRLFGEIKIEKVSFSYDLNGPLILNDISLHIMPGKVTAILGPSGSGKSSLIRLLLGFDTPSSGTIYYDGKDLSKLDIFKVRKQIGVVLQGSTLFAGSIFDNIACGGTYTQKQIDKVLELSGFAEDLEFFPMQLNTLLPVGGEILSGGQKQRLMIARALISEPKILIFDEATSALDNKTQEVVSRNIDALKVTRIVVSHRLTTIKNVDYIYIMDHGKIIDSGSFDELRERSGLFSKMIHRQQL